MASFNATRNQAEVEPFRFLMATLSQHCVAFATSLKSKQLCMSLLRMLNSNLLHASYLLLCIPGRIPSLRWTSGQWQPCRWAALEWVSAFDGNLTVAVSFGNAGSCYSQSCMLWLQYVFRSFTRHASSTPVAPGMEIQGCRPGNCKRLRCKP